MASARKKTLVIPPMSVFPSGSVTVANAGIQPGSMAPGAIEATTFAAGAIDASAIANNAIDAAAIAATALTNAKFAAGALAGLLVKSIQPFTVTILAGSLTGVSAAFTAVNTGKAVIVVTGTRCSDSASVGPLSLGVQFTSEGAAVTTITATRDYTIVGDTVTVGRILEFW